MKKPKKEVRINVKLTKEERAIFKTHCENLKTTISKRIRELINTDLQNTNYEQ